MWWPSDAMRQARAAYARGDWEKAASLARDRLRSAANDRDALRLLARTSVRQGKDQSALELFGKIGPGAMQSDDLFLLSVALHRAGNDTASLQVLEKARSADPDHPETLFELCRAYLARDRLAEAVEVGQRLAAHAGWEARALWLLGTAQRERGDPAGAARLWLRAIDHESAPGGGRAPVVSRKELVRALLQLNRPDEAQRHLQVVLARNRDPETSWLLSRAALQQGNWALTRAAWAECGSFRDENPLAPEPAPLVGTARCTPCHDNIVRAQQASRHARTFARALELGGLDLPAKPQPDRFEPEVTHALSRSTSGRLEQETRVSGKVFRAVVDYAFGSGDRGLTLVGRDQTGQSCELRLSYYPGTSASPWDVTSGHVPRPDTPEEYLGRPLTDDSVRRCLLCHVTDHRAAIEPSGPISSDRGIGCERCHGPAGNHLVAVQQKLPDLAIGRPSQASGLRVVKLCAECHSPRGRTVTPDDPLAVRFQGTTLTWSRCFAESNNALDCVTCHDPHYNVETSAAHYEAQCLSCHSAGERERTANAPKGIVPSEASARAVCPIDPARGCIRCHMPAVKDVVPHSFFTDHYIRVHRS
jgi:tetratricopeptide (TPR) repeat protein